MTDPRTREQLRQERETFDQAKAHDARWFTLRLAMGYTAICLLVAIALVSGDILLDPTSYAPATLAVAATTLLVNMLGLVASIGLLAPEVTFQPIAQLLADKDLTEICHDEEK